MWSLKRVALSSRFSFAYTRTGQRSQRTSALPLRQVRSSRLWDPVALKDHAVSLLDQSYSGYSGSLRLTGMISAIRPSQLRRQVASVRQDIQIFSRTLRFNFALGNPTISEQDLLEAIQITCSESFVARLGLDFTLKERGVNMSVGEGQLLTFARTMSHNPTIVILDEATASVDSLTESRIQLQSRIF